MEAVQLELIGEVVTDAPVGSRWSAGGPLILADTDPYRPSQPTTNHPVRCVCGGTITLDLETATVGLEDLSDEALTAFGLERTDRVRGFRSLQPSGALIDHGDHRVLAVVSVGEMQPGRDVVAYHGVGAVVSTPADEPRRPNLTGSDGWAVAAFVALAGMLLAVLVWIHWSAIGGVREQSQLERSGESAVAVVVDRRESRVPGQADAFWITYSFTADSGTVVTESRVDENIHRLASPGSEVSIRYDAAAPSRSVVLGDDSDVIGLGAVVLLDVVLLVLVLLAIRRHRRTPRGATPAC